jgi:hypothetical protein
MAVRNFAALILADAEASGQEFSFVGCVRIRLCETLRSLRASVVNTSYFITVEPQSNAEVRRIFRQIRTYRFVPFSD